MEHPENDEGDRQREQEEAAKRVAKRPVRREAEKELQIGRKCANDQRRQNKARSPEGICCRSVSQGKGHTSYYRPLRDDGSALRFAKVPLLICSSPRVEAQNARGVVVEDVGAGTHPIQLSGAAKPPLLLQPL